MMFRGPQALGGQLRTTWICGVASAPDWVCPTTAMNRLPSGVMSKVLGVVLGAFANALGTVTEFPKAKVGRVVTLTTSNPPIRGM
jgi:hypothetical protein